MSAIVKGIFILGAKRTPFGTYGGALRNTSATQLQVIAAKAALEAAGVCPEQVDSVNIGHAMPSSQADGCFVPRHVLLHCGIPIDRPALGVNRLCGSGFQSVINGAQDILVGAARISLTGGVENMSQMPFMVREIRFGTTLGAPTVFEDVLIAGMYDTYCKLGMALTGENMAVKFNMCREDVDAFALSSQQRWAVANEAGVFKTEIVPVPVKVKGRDVSFKVDEHPRPKSTLEALAKLKPVFKKDGVVTAGSASGICDGAGAVVLASEEAANELQLSPLARLVAFSTVGVPPEIMGIGPVRAIQEVLRVAQMTIEDIDLFEINEAFGVQALVCSKELGLDPCKLNVNGGAIAIGHPLGASGSRITGHLVHELRRRGLKRAIGSACIGGGQGIALLIEAV